MKQFICLAFTVMASFSLAQLKPGKGNPTAAPNKSTLNYEYALNDPYNARIYTLRNGLKVYLTVYKDAPRIQTMIAVRAGSKNDPSDATGLAHYLEHMLFKGTDKFGTKNAAKELVEITKIENLYELYRQTKDETIRKKIYHQIDSISGVAAKYAVANEYDKMISSIGADGTNAFTSFDQTVYVNDIPNNQIENWLNIEAERFRKPVLRLFHTELEAVYEEKNRGLDDDNRKSFEALFEALFPKNKYGTQTTIGTIEHLKNPSMKEINKFYNKWYVPNNMAIIMSGDFDPDKVIVQIEKYFGTMPSKPIEAYIPEKEEAIAAKLLREVYGPDPEVASLVWRFDGDDSPQGEMIELISAMLTNGKAGLIDINLNQAQKVIGAYSFAYTLKDYSIFALTGSPKQDQKLEEVESHLYAQIELLKKGEFPDWLLDAVKTDLRLNHTKSLENNYERSNEMLRAFINDIRWQKHVERLNRIQKITKQELVEFANQYLKSSNYAVVYKRIGEDKNVEKVEKPIITPVELDRENSTPFAQKIYNSKVSDIQPVFMDYTKDIQKSKTASGLEILYNKNKENNLFELFYKFDFGKNNDKLAEIAVKFIDFIGTKELSSAQLKQELFKLGCSFSVFIDTEDTWISLSGLSSNFDKALQLFETVLNNPVVDETALNNMIEDIVKDREDAKQQKGIILNRALVSYARFGSENSFTNQFSNEELKNIKPKDIEFKLKQIIGYEHKVLYYGPDLITNVINSINKYHNAPQSGFVKATNPKSFTSRKLENEVYVIDFDMKQAEIVMLNQGEKYNAAKVPLINLYNAYFGNGMSGVVFQDLRESKALAYSVYSRYVTPNKPEKEFFNISYIGSQVDKLQEAMKGMTDLLTEMPRANAGFTSAKDNLLQGIRSERITKSGVLFNYLEAQKFGFNTDVRKDIYEKVSKYTYDDVLQFQREHIKGKKTTVCVIGKKENLDFKVLEKYGTVKVLTLKEVFGY